MAAPQLKEVKELPPIIAIDEYKGDTSERKFQVIIADPVNRQSLDILPNRKTVKKYLRSKGGQDGFLKAWLCRLAKWRVLARQ